MAYSEAQKRATMKYKQKAYDRIEINVSKGTKEVYKAQAAKRGLSLQAYIVSLIEADMAIDGAPSNEG